MFAFKELVSRRDFETLSSSQSSVSIYASVRLDEIGQISPVQLLTLVVSDMYRLFEYRF